MRRNGTQFFVMCFSTLATDSIASLLACTVNGRILLANLFQSSRSTLSCVSFLSVFAFQAGMWGTRISILLNSPTVTHEPGLSTAYENSPAICSSSTSSARGLANTAGRELIFRATSGPRQLTLSVTELTFRASSLQTAARAQSNCLYDWGPLRAECPPPVAPAGVPVPVLREAVRATAHGLP